MGGLVCCEPRSSSDWNDSSSRNLVLLPKPVRTDYDRVFDLARVLLTELDCFRKEFLEVRQTILNIAEIQDSYSIDNAIKSYIWSVSANMKGNFSSKDMHIDRNRSPHIFIKLDETIRFPDEIYRFEKALITYFHIMFTHQNRIDDIIIELEPIGARVEAMIKCESSDNKPLRELESENAETINLAQENLKEMRKCIRSAKDFRDYLTRERAAFELSLNKFEATLKSAKGVGFESNKRSLFTPKDIAEFYVLL